MNHGTYKNTEEVKGQGERRTSDDFVFLPPFPSVFAVVDALDFGRQRLKALT